MHKLFERVLISALLLFVAAVATAVHLETEESLCSGAAVCTVSSFVGWGMGTSVEIELISDTGCPVAATYKINGRNGRGKKKVVVYLSSSNPIHRMTSHQMYKKYRIIPSDSTGCTDLNIVLRVVHERG